MRRLNCVFAAALLCFGGPLDAEPPVPLVDHHQHLLSPAGAALVNTPQPKEALPASLKETLERRGAEALDPQRLRLAYTTDALIFTGDGDWLVGRDRIAAYVKSVFRRAHRLTPIAAHVAGSTANIVGYYTIGEGSEARQFGEFFMQLRKSGTTWQIAVEKPIYTPPKMEAPVDAAAMVKLLDDAGIHKAVILSNAYYFDTDARAAHYPLVRAENDWTLAQARKFPDRLIPFCSFNPLAGYALEELARCKRVGFAGIKLHFRSSRVNLTSADHLTKLRAVFAAADAARLPIILHARPGENYGGREARNLLGLLRAAPDVPVTIAHLWGGESFSADALEAFADAVKDDPEGTRNLYFDLAQVAMVALPEQLPEIVSRMREIGFSHILYGSDGPEFGGLAPKDEWALLHKRMPLTEAEFDSLARNVAPYAR